jgi:hypothetical protein
MKETISQIRGLLNSLEQEVSDAEDNAGVRMFSGLEIPDIMRDVVDLLMPALTTYQLVYYLYLLRNSILQSGQPYIRASVSGLRTGVVKSAYAEGRSSERGVSVQSVREALRALEGIGAIRREGEPNRDGTLYRVLLPEEIEVCQQARAEREQSHPVPEIADNEIDYYNVRENRAKVYERDSYKCQYCGKQLTRFTATLDHVTPVAEGGDNSFDNLRTACLSCNSQKNVRPVGDFVADKNPT